MSLQGNTVIVVGGSSGIGLETARLALAQGAEVAIASRSAEKLAAAKGDLGGRVETYEVDVTNDQSVADAFAALGPVDHVVHTAPGAAVGTIRDIAIDTAQAGFNAKFWGALRTAKYARIRDGGSLTYVSGQMARRPRPNMVLGGCANAAVEALARGLAIEMALIRVNTVSPGFIDTPLHDRMTAEVRKAAFSAAEDRLPVKRAGRPQEIASMIVEMMQNGFVTGATIQVDGGAHVLL